ncbi:MAG TPA: HAD family phosphatase [Actinomycetales bacterium]|jgi:HAD superfamily hydrolase (TIGR01509 family)
MAGTWPAAILWDMDGTLVDTEPYWFDAEFALVAAHGGRWSDAHAHSLVGQDLLASAAYIRTHGPVPLEPREIVHALLDDVVSRVREHVPWRPGAPELLAEQRAAGIPAALVTMSWRSLADTLVAALPDRTFAAVVTGDEVDRGKPDPEAYLLAARQLGLQPGDCLAIEDSVPGTASARAAGVPVLAVPLMTPLAPAPGQVLVESLAGLDLEALRTLFGR